MSSAASIAAEVVSDIGEKAKSTAKGVVGSAQAEGKGFSLWKIGAPVLLFIAAMCAGFYALVVGSGTIALGAIAALVIGIALVYYLVKSLF